MSLRSRDLFNLKDNEAVIEKYSVFGVKLLGEVRIAYGNDALISYNVARSNGKFISVI